VPKKKASIVSLAVGDIT